MIKLILFLFLIYPSYPAEEDSILSEVFWKITVPYFKNKKAIIISIRTKSSACNDHLQLLLKQDVTAVVYNNFHGKTRMFPDFKMEEIEDNNYGYVFASDSTDTIIQEFEIIHVKHSNAKIIILLMERSPEDILLLFKSAWKIYDMLNIIAVLITVNRTESSFEHIRFLLYNPFITQTESLLTLPVDNANATIVSKILMKKIYQRLLNVHQHPLRIGLFDFIGLAKAVEDENGIIVKFEEPDGEIANIVAKTSNFKPVYVTPPEGTMYGGRRPDGSYTGSLGLLENNKVDVTLNLRVLSSIGQRISTFLPPLGSSKIVFVTPNIEPKSRSYLFKILDLSSSLGITGAFFIMVIAQCLLDKMNHLYIHPKNRFHLDIIQYGLIALGIMISISQHLPTTLYKRILLISLILFSMIVTCYYQAKMVQVLTAGRDSQNVETLEQLADSNLNILIPISVRNFLPPADSADVVYQKLYQRHFPMTDFDKSFKRVAYDRDAALFVLRFCAEPYIYFFYSYETDASLVHIVPEAPVSVLVANMVQKQCSFRERIADLMMKVYENGLYWQLMKKSTYKMRLKALRMSRGHILQENQGMFTMKKLKIVFVMFSIYEVICIVVFCMELVVFHLSNK